MGKITYADLKWSLCQIDPAIKIHLIDLDHTSREEQECLFVITREGIEVSCSFPKYIRKLSRSSLFLVTEITLSKSDSNTIISLDGTLNNGLTIRKKRYDTTNLKVNF